MRSYLLALLLWSGAVVGAEAAPDTLFVQPLFCWAHETASVASKAKFRLERGETVHVIARRPAWANVEASHGKGWIPQVFLVDTAPYEKLRHDTKVEVESTPLASTAEYRPDFSSLEKLSSLQPNESQVKEFRQAAGFNEP